MSIKKQVRDITSSCTCGARNSPAPEADSLGPESRDMISVAVSSPAAVPSPEVGSVPWVVVIAARSLPETQMKRRHSIMKTGRTKRTAMARDTENRHGPTSTAYIRQPAIRARDDDAKYGHNGKVQCYTGRVSTLNLLAETYV